MMLKKLLLAIVGAVSISHTVFAGIAEDIQGGASIEDALRTAVEAGMTVDQAVGDAIMGNVDRAGDIIAAAYGILGDLPGTACRVLDEEDFYIQLDPNTEKTRVTGPYTEAQIKNMLLTKEITLDDEVSRDQGHWYLLGRVQNVVPEEMWPQLARDAKVLALWEQEDLEACGDRIADAAIIAGADPAVVLAATAAGVTGGQGGPGAPPGPGDGNRGGNVASPS